MSFQLPTKEEKHDYCLEQFERIAKGYDLSNDVISMGMHRAWKLRAVHELLGTRERGDFLDVCCGTGDLALKIARRLKPGSSVTGFDFAQNMLDLAKVREQKLIRRLARARSSSDDSSKHSQRHSPEHSQKHGPEHSQKHSPEHNTEHNPRQSSKQTSIHSLQHYSETSSDFEHVKLNWVRGDAQNMPFADNTFDGAIISFGLRNLTDLQKGIDEMTRVVKPGAYVINLDLGHCQTPIFAPIFSAYFSHVVPVLGGILQNDKTAYTYLPESLSTYPRPQGISAIFQKAGLKDVVHVPLALGTVAMHSGMKL